MCLNIIHKTFKTVPGSILAFTARTLAPGNWKCLTHVNLHAYHIYYLLVFSLFCFKPEARQNWDFYLGFSLGGTLKDKAQNITPELQDENKEEFFLNPSESSLALCACP